MADDSFREFHERFLRQQQQFLQDLTSASTNHADNPLQPLLARVIDHYQHYYQSKSKWAKHHVLSMFSSPWTSSLEHAFQWTGGWRPSSAFHLLYSAAGLHLEAHFHDIVSGLATGNLGDLSASQLASIDGFQREVIREEREITEAMAAHQETVADSAMVELSDAVSKAEMGGGDAGEMERRVEEMLAPKESGLEGILQKADDLRLATLKGIVEILSPLQGVHFLIAAAQLYLRFHEWGAKIDALSR